MKYLTLSNGPYPSTASCLAKPPRDLDEALILHSSFSLLEPKDIR